MEMSPDGEGGVRTIGGPQEQSNRRTRGTVGLIVCYLVTSRLIGRYVGPPAMLDASRDSASCLSLTRSTLPVALSGISSRMTISSGAL